jgi:hypothetical protein
MEVFRYLCQGKATGEKIVEVVVVRRMDPNFSKLWPRDVIHHQLCVRELQLRKSVGSSLYQIYINR